MTQEEIREDVESIMQALGVSHNRLDNLVNEIKDNLGKDTLLKVFELKTNRHYAYRIQGVGTG